MILGWLEDFFKVLRKALRFRVERPTLEILEEYHSDGMNVFRINDSSIPGCCDFWRIDRTHERTKFFICIINIRQLQIQLNALGITPSRLPPPGGSKLSSHIEKQIKEQKQIDGSHYWITGWNKTYSAIDKKGRHYQSHRTVDVNALVIDIQGAAGPFIGDKYAHRFSRKIVKQLSSNEFREIEYHRTWVAAVKSVDWLSWLSGLSKSSKGIGKEHILQPKKPDRQRIGSSHRLNS